MFTVTLSKGRGKGKMKKDSHPLACQHSGRWHLFLRSVNLINKLGTSLGHKTNIPILGSKQRLNLQGQHKSLAGKGGPSTNSCSGACSCLFLKGGKDTGKARGCRRPPQSQCDAASGRCSCTVATILSTHRAAVAKDSPRDKMWGYHQPKGDGNPK